MIHSQRRYLTFADLQAMLGGRSRSSIYRDLKMGSLPRPFKLGGRVYWAEAEVEEALAALRSL